MKRKRDELSLFFDLEADVDDSDKEEDEDDEQDSDDDGFIDDMALSNQYRPPNSFEETVMDTNHGDWADLVASLEDRYTSTTPVADGNGSEHPLQSHPAIAGSLDKIARLPTSEDYRCWRVRCKLGLEIEVVFSLCRLVLPKHELRSAIINSRVVGGWVYLEATMNKYLGHLLSITPGVIHDRGGLVYQRMEHSEVLKMLMMKTQAGQWMTVRKGVYKGDVGYVLRIHDSSAHLLLVPRLALRNTKGTQRSHLTPALFDHEAARHEHGSEPVVVQDNIYSFHGDRFEHGLIVKQFPLKSLSTGVSSMPLRLFSPFRESLHPRLLACESTFPRPSEWLFSEDDEVCIWHERPPIRFWNDYVEPTAYKTGTISTIRTDSVDVCTEEGILVAPWLAIRKVIREGDYVEITGGIHHGQTGWVIAVRDGAQATIVLQVMAKKSMLSDDAEIEAHVNLLKVVDVPHALVPAAPFNVVSMSERIPWINTPVFITGRHPLRTCPGIVLGVLPGQQTPSGIRIEIQLTRLDSASPFRRLTLDYDDVVEASRGIKLHDYDRAKSQIFTPRNWTPLTYPPVLIPQPSFESQVPTSIPGCATPVPESPYPSSPAWNPCSDIQCIVTDTPQITDHSPESGVRITLLDPRLLNVQLSVIVTGGGFNEKEVTASVHSIAGRLSLRHTVYKKSSHLDEDWVTPKHPNPTRDNGLLVVIKGVHCGKYVRRIHHRYEGQDAVVILAVVERVAGQADNLTSERLELDVSFLCVCKELSPDKERNRFLMNSLREEARKTRAK